MSKGTGNSAPRILFVGSKALGLSILQTLHAAAPELIVGAITLDDSADTRSALDGFRAFCEQRGVPLAVASGRRHSEALIAEFRPDRCFVAGWYWLIGPAVLEAVPGGFLGIHYSRLPTYRGTSPLVWQMINGEPEAWFSIFTLTNGMDEGAVWAQDSVPIADDDYVGTILERLEGKVLATLSTLYPAIVSGEAEPRAQPDLTPTYCVARLPEDGEIDFGRSARECFDFIRAQSHPYPGAFTRFEDEVLRVWRARPLDTIYYGRPGQVARVGTDGVTVICGDARPLVLEAVGWRGANLPAQDVIRSVKTRLPRRPL